MIPNKEQALELLKKYNSDPFHIKHGLIVSGVVEHFAKELDYADEADFWGVVGLLHDLDFEQYPDQHCIKSQELVRVVIQNFLKKPVISTVFKADE